MTDQVQSAPGVGSGGLQKQPPALEEMLRSLDTAKKALALYGREHPTTTEFADGLATYVEQLIGSFRRPTCVFTKTAVIVNEHAFAPSDESNQVLRLLRDRGAMAVTLVEQPSREELFDLLAFLATDPDNIRREGGASAYLRGRGVRRIAVTDAVYASDEENADEESARFQTAQHAEDVDLAISYAIEWLSKQDEEDESPRLPITEILSDPDMAARLIREAVSKLHASRRDYTDGELATEVVNDLKDLAAAESQDWDEAAPQIRKAMSKLPKEMLPAARGFSVEEKEEGNASKTAPVDEVEQMVAAACGGGTSGKDEGSLPDPSAFGELFGARATGLLSNWRQALQPSSVLRSSGKTLETLMIWEQRPAEHSRIARSLASLIPRAVETQDTGSALAFAGSLMREAGRKAEAEWRASGVISALQSVDKEALCCLIDAAVGGRDYEAAQIAGALVESVAGLALSLLRLLGTNAPEPFTESLRRGIVKAGRAALEPLGDVMLHGSAPAKEAALEAVVEIGGELSAEHIARALKGADPTFSIKVFQLLSKVRVPAVIDICLKALSDSCVEVRCAALKAIGQLGGGSAILELARVATRRGSTTEERVAAVEALGRTGQPEARQHLDDIARRRPLIGRRGYEAVRAAAQRAAEEIRRADSAA